MNALLVMQAIYIVIYFFNGHFCFNSFCHCRLVIIVASIVNHVHPLRRYRLLSNEKIQMKVFYLLLLLHSTLIYYLTFFEIIICFFLKMFFTSFVIYSLSMISLILSWSTLSPSNLAFSFHLSTARTIIIQAASPNNCCLWISTSPLHLSLSLYQLRAVSSVWAFY